MFHLKEETQTRIEESIERIVAMFSTHCRDGAQSKLLSGANACGQFVGKSARDIRQRGIHGTAAALRVLSNNSNGTNAELVAGLVKYLADRKKSEEGANGGELAQQTEVKLVEDSENVIKQAEVLLALATVPNSVPHVKKVAGLVTKSLVESQNSDGGWGYFIDQEKSELLPTAWAMLALSSASENVASAIDFLNSGLKSSESNGTRNDLISRVFVLYALVFQKQRPSKERVKQYTETFVDLWQQLEPSMAEDIEHNLEYWRGDETFYVRIPYQLYLVALSARLRLRAFASRSTQDRLGSILDRVLNGGFSYPHSGSRVSARTNAILFEVLNHVSDELRHMRAFWPLYAIDKARRLLSHGKVRSVLWLCALTAMLWSVYSWSQDPEASWADLAPEFAAPAFFALLTFRKANVR